MSARLTRREWMLGSALTACALAARRAEAALRVPSGGVLRLPSPAARRVHDPARAIEFVDVWPLALMHESVATIAPDGTATWPLLAFPPLVDRGDPRVVTLTLRPSMTFSNGAPVTATAVVEAWQGARQGALGRLALARFATMSPFEARGEREVIVRLALAQTLDEALSAHPLALTAPGIVRPGIGPFMARGSDVSALVRNARCPTGVPFLERVELAAPRERNDELRAFTTGALDASWWGNSLYEVSRPAELVRATPSAVVGIVPAPGSFLASAASARSLEQVLAPLATGEGALVTSLGFTPTVSADSRPDVPALTRAARDRGLRLAREAGDGFLNRIAERVVALLDAVQVRVMLVGAHEAADATLRAIAPLGTSAPLALASFVAAAGGDEAGASAVVRTPTAQRASVAAGVWGRGTAAVLGRAQPVLYVRTGVRDARFDAAGRLLLGDAWVART